MRRTTAVVLAALACLMLAAPLAEAKGHHDSKRDRHALRTLRRLEGPNAELIRSVHVGRHGGSVVVHTRFYPKASNRDGMVEACVNAQGLGSKRHTPVVRVYGIGGLLLESSRGMCRPVDYLGG